jgi:uncharacterized protein involved in exopolysaccharide biosynthesis
MQTCWTKILGLTLLLAGLALCGAGLWLLLSPAQYRATATIALKADDMDIVSAPGQGMSYDPYFLQTELETIKSAVVLSNVVEALNLKVVWGKKYGDGSPLETAKTIKRLQWRMKLEPVRNTTLIKISFTSEDPNEAARIANAIPKAYHNYRMARHHATTVSGIKALEEQYQKQEQEIQAMQTNVDLLREKYKINKDDEANSDNGDIILSKEMTPTEREEFQKEYERTKPFWDEKRKLREMLELHKLLAAKIEVEEMYIHLPKTSMVEIIENADAPKFPASPNRWLGAAFLIVGLFPTVGGLLLLKSSNRKSA